MRFCAKWLRMVLYVIVLHSILRSLISKYMASTLSGCAVNPFISVEYMTVFTKCRWPWSCQISCTSFHAASASELATRDSTMQPRVISVGSTSFDCISCQRAQTRSTSPARPNPLIMAPYSGAESVGPPLPPILLSPNAVACESKSNRPTLRQASVMEHSNTSSAGSLMLSARSMIFERSTACAGDETILRRIEQDTWFGSKAALRMSATKRQAASRSPASA
mmetsp:Transcript_76116/g.150502  ORF Transcript_76116/g.150502 Transcript_76116/m.150502 type:complete len:222 (-) Transcript_76116:1136-1801(-)